MVKHQDTLLDLTFAALADPTRRALLARLEREDSLTISELAEPFDMTLPAVLKHLNVLSDAALITREKTGRIVACRLSAAPMEQAINWLNRYQRFWNESFDRLNQFVEKEKMDAALDTRPSLTIKRHINGPPAQVFAAWTDPQKIARWFGPKGASDVQARTDPRVGGGFRMTFRTPDGAMNDVSGSYREVVADKRLVFTWTWSSTPERESLVTVIIAADGAGTLLTFTHEQFTDEAARDAHHEGWSGALDKIEAMFA